MATSTRASKNDQRTTLLFVLSLTVGKKKKKKVVSNKAFQFKTLCHETAHKALDLCCVITAVPEGPCSLRDEIWRGIFLSSFFLNPLWTHTAASFSILPTFLASQLPHKGSCFFTVSESSRELLIYEGSPPFWFFLNQTISNKCHKAGDIHSFK